MNNDLQRQLVWSARAALLLTFRLRDKKGCIFFQKLFLLLILLGLAWLAKTQLSQICTPSYATAMCRRQLPSRNLPTFIYMTETGKHIYFFACKQLPSSYLLQINASERKMGFLFHLPSYLLQAWDLLLARQLSFSRDLMIANVPEKQ